MTNIDYGAECFLISPIGEHDSIERTRSDGVLKFVVSRAAAELGLTCARGDQISEPGQITRQVIDHVLNARACVADLTGRNPNVFYELAVRHTARLPVVLIAELGEILPFDLAPMRTIFFDHRDLASADEARGLIAEQLRRSLDGPVDSPISTSIDLRALEAAGGVVERRIADVITRLDELTTRQGELAHLIAAHSVTGDIVLPPMAVDKRQLVLDEKIITFLLTASSMQRDALLNQMLRMAQKSQIEIETTHRSGNQTTTDDSDVQSGA